MHDSSQTTDSPVQLAAAAAVDHSSVSDVSEFRELHAPVPSSNNVGISADPMSPTISGGVHTNIMPSRLIRFNVEHRSRNVHIELQDSETVGRIKEDLEATLHIPVVQQELKGLMKHRVTDSTVLRDLYLPRDNVLYLLTSPPPAQPSNSNSPGTVTVSHKCDQYKLKILFNGDAKYSIFNFTVKGNKTVGSVKQDISSITGVPVNLQQWYGFPPTVTDNTLVCDSGIHFPSAELEMSVMKKPLKANTAKPLSSEQPSREAQYLSEDDVLMESEEEIYTDVQHARRQRPLMMPNTATEMEALEHFSNAFAERYGEAHPVFYMGALDDAVRDAFRCKAEERKLLALYLHHDTSIQAHIFCSQLLCSECVINVLSSEFLVWAWDLTTPENKKRFLNAATKQFGSEVADTIQSYHRDQFPVVLIISRTKSTNEVLDVIQGHLTVNELMTRLLHAVDVFTDQRNEDIAAEKEHHERERLIREQDAAYRESLQADREKAEAARKQLDQEKLQKEHVMAAQKEEEQKQLEEKERKEAAKESQAGEVPEEPPDDAEGAVSSLRFRIPGGQVIARRFWVENTVQDVLMFLASQGFPEGEYKVLTPFPRLDITSLDRTQTLQATRLFPRETLIVEEK